jgi:hypothetical protein
MSIPELKPWLTFEPAAPLNHTDTQTLETLAQTQDPETAFREAGLQFDRSRFEQGQPCLQMLESPKRAPSDSTPAKTEEIPGERTYQWETLELNLQIRWQSGSPRRALITATSYDDFPIATLVDADQLTPFPEPVQALLDQLQQDLPIRALRYQQRQAKANKKKPSTTAKPPTAQPTKPVDTAAKEPSKASQISLF